MEAEISQLVSRYDRGSLSRRELIQGLAILAAAVAGTTESAIAATPFQVNSFGHVSLQVRNLDSILRQAERNVLAGEGSAANGKDDVLLAVEHVRHRRTALRRRHDTRRPLPCRSPCRRREASRRARAKESWWREDRPRSPAFSSPACRRGAAGRCAES
jgi:hypothetical protein